MSLNPRTDTALYASQCLQGEATSTSSQLAELLMAARVNLSSELPVDLPPDALLSRGSFLINLEGEQLPPHTLHEEQSAVALVTVCSPTRGRDL